MKSLTDLIVALINESASRHSIDARRDIVTIRHRVEHEGESFLTLTLPTMGDSLLQSITSGQLNPNDYKSFKFSGSLPCLFKGFFRRVFDNGGSLHSDAPVWVIRDLRMICKVCSKIKYEPTPLQTAAAEGKFHETDTNVYGRSDIDSRIYARFEHVARIVTNDISQECSDFEHLAMLRYGHGPGAVSDASLRGTLKYGFGKEWSSNLDSTFPVADYAYENYSAWSIDKDEDVPLVVETASMPVRVVFVPKTVKGPRVIAIEPAGNQFIQQGLKNLLYEKIETSPYTRNSIRFSDQTENQRLACRGSIDGSLATIDLSEASDRVSYEHVMDLFKSNPVFQQAIDSCRSTHATLPSGKVVRLNKFASMGSALCFPMESLLFYVVIQTAFHEHHNVPITPQSIKKFSKSIDIYGDDIIIPTDMVGVTVTFLERFGLKVNINKSFSKGPFRESCGTERYNGYEIRPKYLRIDPFSSTNDPTELLSLLAFAHQLCEYGFVETAGSIRTAYEQKHLFQCFSSKWRNIPEVPVGTSGGWPSFSGYSHVSYNRDLQCSFARILMAKPKLQLCPENSYRLRKFLFETSNRTFSNDDSSPILDRDWATEPQSRNALCLKLGSTAL
jgi:hypothetical protein